MKRLLLATLFAFPAVPLSAAIVYSGPQNLSVNWDDLEGVYINLATQEVAHAFPDGFDDSAWINFTLGGTNVFNGDLLRPWSTSAGIYDPDLETDYYLNLAPGATVDLSGSFREEVWSSIKHVGYLGEAGKFAIGESGYLGFEFQTEAGGAVYYGWIQFTPRNSGTGTIMDWAYNDTPGEALQVGAVPEPSTAGMLLGGLGLLARRRRGKGNCP